MNQVHVMHAFDQQEFLKWARVSGAQEGASEIAAQHRGRQGHVGRWRPGKLTEGRPPRPGLSGQNKQFIQQVRGGKHVVIIIMNMVLFIGVIMY